MSKIINYIKKNYITFSIIIAIILVILGSVIIINIISKNIHKIKTDKNSFALYEYFEDEKESFNADIFYEDDKIVKIDSKDYNIYENGIIYYEEGEKALFPKDMMIVFYNKDNLAYKLHKYSEVENDNKANIIYTGGKKVLNDDFFLYDGEDIYFFIRDALLKVNDEEILLSKYSYVYARNDDLLYYDKKDDKAVIISDVKKASVSLGNTQIDLLKDATVSSGKVIILESNLANMSLYKED